MLKQQQKRHILSCMDPCSAGRYPPKVSGRTRIEVLVCAFLFSSRFLSDRERTKICPSIPTLLSDSFRARAWAG